MMTDMQESRPTGEVLNDAQAAGDKVSFQSDEFQLAGWLHLPDTELPPVVIGAHGLFSNAAGHRQLRLANALNRVGIAYLRFDHRGCGESDGVFGEATTFDGRCRDMETAVNFARNHPETGDRIGLFGSSIGGAVALATGVREKPLCGVCYAAPMKSDHIGLHMRDQILIQAHEAGLDLTQLRFSIESLVEGLSGFMVIHGDSDRVVQPSEAHRLYRQMVMPKRLIMLKNGDHRLTDQENEDKFIRESISWYQQHLFSRR